MSELPKNDELKHEIFKHYVEIPNWRTLSPFCVDGRESTDADEPLYPQALGGSLHFAVLSYLLDDTNTYPDMKFAITQTFQTLKDQGFALGVHGDDHAPCGCGFCNKLRTIVTRLQEKKDDIANILSAGVPNFDKVKWKNLIENVGNNIHGKTVKGGAETLEHAKSIDGVQFQTLTGSHQEVVAVVNTIERTTLDTKTNQSSQAFNLDLWYVQEGARALGLPMEESTLLSLGLYVATEMVLVEDTGKSRLPIFVR